MTGDKFRARADGHIKAARVVTDPEHKLALVDVAQRSSRPDPNKVSPLNSLAWSDASTELRRKFMADIGVRAWLAATPPEWLPELERYVGQHRIANPPAPPPAAELEGDIPGFLQRH